MRLETSRPQPGPVPQSAAHYQEAAVELSLVVPIHNESAGLDEFFARVLPVLKNLGCSFEIICVDDGSSDGSLERLLACRQRVPNLKVLSLSRNFGKDVALSAGFEHVSGAAAVPLDADLQDPPELIAQMVAKWREGFDVVYATRARRDGESILRQVSARYFYRIFDRITDMVKYSVKIPRGSPLQDALAFTAAPGRIHHVEPFPPLRDHLLD